jgi:hypothetical protein
MAPEAPRPKHTITTPQRVEDLNALAIAILAPAKKKKKSGAKKVKKHNPLLHPLNHLLMKRLKLI